MEFIGLRYFHETARLGSIRSAADSLHVTPSSISRMIANLEQEFGARLFERTSKGMRLTDAGVVLARQTQRMFRDFERVRSVIDDLQGLRRGQVTIYGPEGLVAEFMPKLLSEFHARYPAIAFNVHFASTDQIVEAIINDKTDIGITFNGPSRSDLSTVVEYSEPLRCLVAPGHPMACEKKVSLKHIVKYPLALPEVSFGMRRLIDEALISEGLTPNLSLNTNSLELAKRMAMTGAAIAFMPGFMVSDDVAMGRLVSIAVDTPVFTDSRVSVCIHRDREISFSAQELLRFLQARFSLFSAQSHASSVAIGATQQS